MKKIKHLRDVGMNYGEHYSFAWGILMRLFSIIMRLQAACWALMVHMLCPWWFETTASSTIKKLAKELEEMTKEFGDHQDGISS